MRVRSHAQLAGLALAMFIATFVGLLASGPDGPSVGTPAGAAVPETDDGDSFFCTEEADDEQGMSVECTEASEAGAEAEEPPEEGLIAGCACTCGGCRGNWSCSAESCGGDMAAGWRCCQKCTGKLPLCEY
jgi:hypothetical protein